ncbi:MAG: hypothetical protein ABJP02_04920 [Parasphingorhabdus sp.]|uniref:hypothetical protein n=1 Tax=Parasphingorhabdus sp. TaxID=2709688 RepID=UPI003296DA02
MPDNFQAPASGVDFASKDIGGVQFAKNLITDEAGADAVGLVTANPAANTILGRLKAAVDALSGKATEAKQDDAITQLAAIVTALGGTLAVNQADGATATRQDSAIVELTAIKTAVDGLETLLADNATDTGLAAIVTALSGAATDSKLDELLTAMGTIGTRAYGANVPAVNSVAASSRTAAGIVATEVLVHASKRCFIKVGDNTVNATAADIPLEDGEKFHLKITSGQFIAAIRDTEDGVLNIITVA